MASTSGQAMEFEVLAKCSTTRARVSRMRMPHGETMTPTFMPVATVCLRCLFTASELTTVFSSERNYERSHTSSDALTHTPFDFDPQQYVPSLFTTRNRDLGSSGRIARVSRLGGKPVDRFWRVSDGELVSALFGW